MAAEAIRFIVNSFFPLPPEMISYLNVPVDHQRILTNGHSMMLEQINSDEHLSLSLSVFGIGNANPRR